MAQSCAEQLPVYIKSSWSVWAHIFSKPPCSACLPPRGVPCQDCAKVQLHLTDSSSCVLSSGPATGFDSLICSVRDRGNVECLLGTSNASALHRAAWCEFPGVPWTGETLAQRRASVAFLRLALHARGGERPPAQLPSLHDCALAHPTSLRAGLTTPLATQRSLTRGSAPCRLTWLRQGRQSRL